VISKKKNNYCVVLSILLLLILTWKSLYEKKNARDTNMLHSRLSIRNETNNLLFNVYFKRKTKCIVWTTAFLNSLKRLVDTCSKNVLVFFILIDPVFLVPSQNNIFYRSDDTTSTKSENIRRLVQNYGLVNGQCASTNTKLYVF